jgi:hypothetical protein
VYIYIYIYILQFWKKYWLLFLIHKWNLKLNLKKEPAIFVWKFWLKIWIYTHNRSQSTIEICIFLYSYYRAIPKIFYQFSIKVSNFFGKVKENAGVWANSPSGNSMWTSLTVLCQPGSQTCQYVWKCDGAPQCWFLWYCSTSTPYNADFFVEMKYFLLWYYNPGLQITTMS